MNKSQTVLELKNNNEKIHTVKIYTKQKLILNFNEVKTSLGALYTLFFLDSE